MTPSTQNHICTTRNNGQIPIILEQGSIRQQPELLDRSCTPRRELLLGPTWVRKEAAQELSVQCNLFSAGGEKADPEKGEREA